MTHKTIESFNQAQSKEEQQICITLQSEIEKSLPDATSKIWHRHPVWFLNDNPIVGYNKLKGCIRLMFWSGADFDEPLLEKGTGKFKDASMRYSQYSQLDLQDLQRWLHKSRVIQWDYRNIYKNKGKLVKIPNHLISP